MELLENLGRRILEKRGDAGIRAAAKEIGISHATLSRVERGFLPDVATLQKITRWLGEEMPMPITSQNEGSQPQVHFRRKNTVSPEAAASLAQMILLAQASWDKHRGISPHRDE